MKRVRFRLAHKIVFENTKLLTPNVEDLYYWCCVNVEHEWYSNVVPDDNFWSFNEFVFCFSDTDDAMLFKLYSSVFT